MKIKIIDINNKNDYTIYYNPILSLHYFNEVLDCELYLYHGVYKLFYMNKHQFKILEKELNRNNDLIIYYDINNLKIDIIKGWFVYDGT